MTAINITNEEIWALRKLGEFGGAALRPPHRAALVDLGKRAADARQEQACLSGPIKLLAPQSIDDDGDGSVIIEMTRPAFLALRDGVTVAFEDEDSVPREWRDMASAWWLFMHPEGDAT